MLNPEANQSVAGVSISRSAQYGTLYELAVPFEQTSNAIPLSSLLGILPPDADPNKYYLHIRDITPQSNVVTLADERIVIDQDRRELHVDDVRLFPKEHEFDLLVHLARNPHKVHRRDELLREAWRNAARTDVPGVRTVDTYIARIRDHMRRASADSADLADVYTGAIRTIRGVGYLPMISLWDVA